MKCETKHIGWLLGSMLMLLLTACSSHHDDNNGVEERPTVITFYVYAPERPMPTRAGDLLVNPIEGESAITSLQIWVFAHDDGKLVGYLCPTELPTADGKVYQMAVSKEFADAATKPNVDVYVAANTAAVNLTFDGETTRATLDAAMIGTNYFGTTTTTLVSSVPTAGLPMSGVLLNQEVVGTNPVLRIGTDSYEGMAKVQLQRAVSKVRFVFSQQQGVEESEKLIITGLTLNGKVEEVDYGFPTEEYFFLGNDGNAYRIGSTYVSGVTTLIDSSDPLSSIKESEDPSNYVYDPLVFSTAQDYEDKIDGGVNGTVSEPDKKELTQIGPFYFRETNKMLRGTISYQMGEEGTEQTKTFSMVTPLGFSRNHSWIVYAYYGSGGLDVLTVFVKPWTEVTDNRELYNW
ncbi:MAG: hypothetical protein J6T38_07365 [Bacteroidaceae bacterium]|nr:hypothetical protein [Bacteroidaceae bacterium]